MPCRKTRLTKRSAETKKNLYLDIKRIYFCMSCNAWHLTSMELEEYDPAPTYSDNPEFKKYLNDNQD